MVYFIKGQWRNLALETSKKRENCGRRSYANLRNLPFMNMSILPKEQVFLINLIKLLSLSVYWSLTDDIDSNDVSNTRPLI